MMKMWLTAGILVPLAVGCNTVRAVPAYRAPQATPNTGAERPWSVSPKAPPSGSAAHPLFGVNVDEYIRPKMNVVLDSELIVSYLSHLHANAISVSFPFYVRGANLSQVASGPGTPTPAQLAVIVNDARRAGLYVEIRPLMDEANLPTSRVHWKPGNLTEWFSTYRRWLVPYAKMATSSHVSNLCVGVEFDTFQRNRRWGSLDSALRKYFKGTLSYSTNWDGPSFTHAGGPGVRVSVDAYPPFNIPSTASLTELKKLWIAWAKRLSAGTVLSEVGIAAVVGAYRHPWHSPSGPIVRQVQVRWYTAACAAVSADRLGGLYIWDISFGRSLTVSPGRANPIAFVGSASATAVRQCFTR